NIRHLLDRPGFRFVRGSILAPSVVDQAMDGCDHVYHLAGAVGVKLIFDEPVRTIETNVGGTSIVLDAAARHRATLFLASTSEVYGNNVDGAARAFRETEDIILGRSIRWGYERSKALDDCLSGGHLASWGRP